MQNIYLALYQAVIQYKCLVQSGLSDNSLKPLQLQQNKIIKICLDKKSLEGSINQNYKDFKVLPIRSVYKKIAINWVEKNRNTSYNTETYKNKRQHTTLDAKANYIKTNYCQKSIDYLWPTISNSLDFNVNQKLLYCKNKNQKKKNYKLMVIMCNLP